MIECSLIDLMPGVGHCLVSLIWLLWSDHTQGESGEQSFCLAQWWWQCSSMPWKCFVITSFGWLNCNYVYALLLWGLLLVSTSRFQLKCAGCQISALTFKSALQSCLRIHLVCLTAVKSNLFGPQDCLKRYRGGHRGELIPLLGIPLAPTMWLSGESAVSIVSSCGSTGPKKGWWYKFWMHLDPI
jgi:hypothetical protein